MGVCNADCVKGVFSKPPTSFISLGLFSVMQKSQKLSQLFTSRLFNEMVVAVGFGWYCLTAFCSTFIGNVTIYIYNTYKYLDRK